VVPRDAAFCRRSAENRFLGEKMGFPVDLRGTMR